MDTLVGFKAFLLNLTGSNDALTNLLAWLARLHLGELGKGHSLDLAVDVDTTGDYVTPFA
jgi:hypothetical protein